MSQDPSGFAVRRRFAKMGGRVQKIGVTELVGDKVQRGDMADDRNDNFDHIVRHFLDGQHFFQSSVVQYLYDWWLGFGPDLPARKQFDLVEHASIAPNLFLIKVLGSGKFEYRINGENVVDLVGVSLKGEVISTDHDEIAMVNLSKYYQEIVEHRKARRCTGYLQLAWKEQLPFETVDCPLVGRNGAVTHIVGAIGTL